MVPVECHVWSSYAHPHVLVRLRLLGMRRAVVGQHYNLLRFEHFVRCACLIPPLKYFTADLLGRSHRLV